jgi:hypothetical protein
VPPGTKKKLVTTPAAKQRALELFDRHPELSTREVARRTGIPKSTAARLRHQLGQPSPYHPFRSRTSPGPRDHQTPPPASDEAIVEQRAVAWRVLDTGQVIRVH